MDNTIMHCCCYRQQSSSVLRFVFVFALLLSSYCNAQQKFDPYQLNGGLVAAVAGKDYVVIASDTRFIGPGGYDLLSRDHFESRLWVATTTTPTPPVTQIMQTTQSSTTPTINEKTSVGRTLLSSTTFTSNAPPAFVGSVGCNADCDMLKRFIRSDLRAASYFQECGGTGTGTTTTTSSSSMPATVEQVSRILSHILYSRRGFPYYSFCVVAGLSSMEDDVVVGKVYVYDAIGSYEQVAVASTGTGRELIQPILDRKFNTLLLFNEGVLQHVGGGGQRQQRGRQVSCDMEETISILIDAYRSVSEREIGVGDNLILCTIQKMKPKRQTQRQQNDDDDDDDDDVDDVVQCQVWKVPLKKH